MDVNKTFSLMPYFGEIMMYVPENFQKDALVILRDANDDLVEDLFDIIDNYPHRVKRGNLGKWLSKSGKKAIDGGRKARTKLGAGVRSAIKSPGIAVPAASTVVKFTAKTAAETAVMTGAYIGIDKLLGKDSNLASLKIFLNGIPSRFLLTVLSFQ
uniref:Uncharacterized protein n=1 Tax=Panagrolaimus sp. ES5 TaxID=591445 RepID=A0AC34GCI3_9BILA